MKRFKAFALLAAGAAMVPTMAIAQQVTPPVPTIAAGNSILTVTGQGEADTPPDIAVFSAGVETQAATAGQALAENSTRMSQVIAALKRAGIAERDIQTSNLSVNPIYSDPEQEARIAAQMGQPRPALPPYEAQVRKIIGYQVINTVTVRQRDLKNFGRVIDTLVTAGANQVNGPSFQLEEQEAALNKARAASMRDALAKAQLYAQAAGLRVVRPLTIAEGGGYYQPQPMFRSARAEMGASPPPPAPIQPGELTMNASVTVTYELAP
jgi:uncharacterized protein YggE